MCVSACVCLFVCVFVCKCLYLYVSFCFHECAWVVPEISLRVDLCVNL